MWNDFPGPESYGTQREVWDLGKALYYLLQSELEPPPWDFSSKQYLITEQDLDYGMKFSQFPPELERLLRGMLAINRDERWTAKESLECFERYLSSRQDQNSGVSQ
jgi:serine/threonine protein kinase